MRQRLGFRLGRWQVPAFDEGIANEQLDRHHERRVLLFQVRWVLNSRVQGRQPLPGFRPLHAAVLVETLAEQTWKSLFSLHDRQGITVPELRLDNSPE